MTLGELSTSHLCCKGTRQCSEGTPTARRQPRQHGPQSDADLKDTTQFWRTPSLTALQSHASALSRFRFDQRWRCIKLALCDSSNLSSEPVMKQSSTGLMATDTTLPVCPWKKRRNLLSCKLRYRTAWSVLLLPLVTSRLCARMQQLTAVHAAIVSSACSTLVLRITSA